MIVIEVCRHFALLACFDSVVFVCVFSLFELSS